MSRPIADWCIVGHETVSGMNQQKISLYIGIVLIVIAAVLLLGNFMGDSTFPAILGLLGIIAIGSSKYRPLASKKQ